MEKKSEREKERRGSSVLVQVSSHGLFISALLCGFLPPTPTEDSHRMREMYPTGGSASAHYFHVIAYSEPCWASRQTFISPLCRLSTNLQTCVFAPHSNTQSCETECDVPECASTLLPKQALFLFPPLSQTVSIHTRLIKIVTQFKGNVRNV